MKEGMWMKASGESTTVKAKDGKTFSLEELQKFVGGSIERVAIKGGEMWVNEGAALDDLPMNKAATTLYVERYNYWTAIRGDVLVCMRKTAKRG